MRVGLVQIAMATIAEVARLAGVSVSTVSHVVNRHALVSPEGAELVNDAIASDGLSAQHAWRGR